MQMQMLRTNIRGRVAIAEAQARWPDSKFWSEQLKPFDRPVADENARFLLDILNTV